jgi:hypothetical protein
MPDYIYTGDKLTDPRFVNQPCNRVLNARGKCIRGKNSNMLVEFAGGEIVNVLARRLRKIK